MTGIQEGSGSSSTTSSSTEVPLIPLDDQRDLSEEESELVGAGSGDLVAKIADVVLKKILPSVQQYQNYNLNPPAEIDIVNPSLNPQLPFQVKTTKDDLNDVYDEKALLRLIPPRFKRQAHVLLKQFNEKGQDITWSPEGHLYIDEISIPESNFFILFPALFKKVNAKKITGYQELTKKLEEMGLIHLLPYNIQTKAKKKSVTVVSSLEATTSSLPENWWFIG